MITIFTIPKAFSGQISLIQRNALESWVTLQPECEIFLMGDDEGIAQAAKEFKCRHFSDIEKSKFGTPLLSSAFALARKHAKNNILMYVNADIILLSNIAAAVKPVDFKDFMIVGRRYDLNVNYLVDFKDSQVKKLLSDKIASQAVLHGYSGTDYFIFKKNAVLDMPSFAVGRQGWDNWFIWKMRREKVPVIDATSTIIAVHQNHDYSHSEFGQVNRVAGPELDYNYKLAGGFNHFLTIRDANLVLNNGRIEKPGFIRRCLSRLSLFYPFNIALSLKRRLQSQLIK
jgi:hypothetical protein